MYIFLENYIGILMREQDTSNISFLEHLNYSEFYLQLLGPNCPSSAEGI